MISFVKNDVLDKTMRNLILSMVSESEYINEMVKFNGQALTSKMERELTRVLEKYKIPCKSLKCDEKILLDNPYYKNIKFDNASIGDIRYEKNIIKRRTLMNMNFTKPIGKYLFHYHPVGYFDCNINMPALKEGNNITWMAPAPSEIESMNDGIKKGHGRCMTMGLGIGILPYLWLLKDDVESVTVVEFNQNIINLFEKHIRPQFHTDKKLEIIHGNAFDYYNGEFLNKFDYTYVDFWESTEDGAYDYIKLMEKNIDNPNIDYWIEDSILADIKCVVAPYLNTIYQGNSIMDFISSLDDDSRIIAKKANKYFKKRNDIIKTEDELLDLIHNKKVLKDILSI